MDNKELEREVRNLKNAWVVVTILNAIVLAATIFTLYQMVSLNKQMLKSLETVAKMLENWPPSH